MGDFTENKNTYKKSKPFEKRSRDFKRDDKVIRRGDTFKNDDELPENLIYGRNTIREAIRAERQIDKLMVARDIDGAGKEIVYKLKEMGVTVTYVDRIQLDKLLGTSSHQGMAAYLAAWKYSTVEDILKVAEDRNEPPFILIADGLSDPHNLGAIIRTAECVGAHGVIIPKRHACGLTPVVAKVSSGALEHIAVAKVGNLVQTINELQKKNIWVAGADMDGQLVYKSDLKGPLAIVVGAEGEGIGRLVRENCDFIISLPLMGKVESLNVSSATSAILYEALRQRTEL